MKARLAILSVVVLIGVSFFYSCGANLFSIDQDVQLGKDMDNQIKADPAGYPPLTGHEDVKSYVSGVGKSIVNSTNLIQYKNVFPYQFTVINDTIINAFCTPGGYIYVYTGLLKFIDNEATLAGVLAHEIAHAENRHTTKRITSYYGVSLALNVVLGNNPNTLADIMSNLFVGLGFLANSRSDEKEADDYSIKYLAAGGKYYPGAIKYFFYKIKDEQQRLGQNPGAIDRLLSTHPLAQDRIDNVFSKLREYNVTSDSTKGLYIQEYQFEKAKLP
ncbi:MAG TPA: M48 family metalloprotease [Ignavibacteria bacterium]|nr:M48 family metalloprotease [Ignavibacteria bacterium]